MTVLPANILVCIAITARSVASCDAVGNKMLPNTNVVCNLDTINQPLCIEIIGERSDVVGCILVVRGVVVNDECTLRTGIADSLLQIRIVDFVVVSGEECIVVTEV